MLPYGHPRSLADQAVHVGNKVTAMHPEYGLYQAPQQYIDQYCDVASPERRNLSAMVAVMDEAAGNVTASLKQHGLWNQTVFIVSTDNGGPLPYASNFPLRGGKGSLWEGGVRGTGFVVVGDPGWLSFVTGGKIVNALIHVTDWLPTLCDAELADCNMAAPAGKKLDGLSAWAAIARNETGQRSELVHDVRAGENAHEAGGKTALRVGRLKILYGYGATPKVAKLFDVVSDVGETADLSADPKYAAVLMTMKARAAWWVTESQGVVDQATVPPDPRANPSLRGGDWLPWLPDNCTDFNCPPPGHGPPGPPMPPGPAPSPTSNCKFTADMDMYPAHTPAHAHGVADAAACCAACKATGPDTCSVAVYADRACYFKPMGAAPRPRPGSVACLPLV